MWEDPIVAEVRKVREAHAAQFNYDLRAIYHDIKKQEAESGREFITLSPKRVCTHPCEIAIHRGVFNALYRAFLTTQYLNVYAI